MAILQPAADLATALVIVGAPAGLVFGCLLFGMTEGFNLK